MCVVWVETFFQEGLICHSVAIVQMFVHDDFPTSNWGFSSWPFFKKCVLKGYQLCSYFSSVWYNSYVTVVKWGAVSSDIHQAALVFREITLGTCSSAGSVGYVRNWSAVLFMNVLELFWTSACFLVRVLWSGVCYWFWWVNNLWKADVCLVFFLFGFLGFFMFLVFFFFPGRHLPLLFHRN